MINTFIPLLFSQAFPILIGLAFLSLFKKRILGIGLRLGLAYGLGTGLLVQWMWLLGIMRIPFLFVNIVSPLSIFMAGCWLYSRRQTHEPLAPWVKDVCSKKMFVLNALLMAFIGCYIGFVLVRAMNVPFLGWDVVATIAFKAKVIFYERSVQSLPRLPYTSYPIHLPLLECWTAIVLRSWDDQLIKIIFPCYYISFLVIFYHALRVFVQRTWALVGVSLLVSAAFFSYHATVGYRDFTLVYYNTLAIMLMLTWMKTGQRTFLWLAAFFTGFMTFVKMEGTVYLFIHTALMGWILLAGTKRLEKWKTKFRSLGAYLIPSYGIFLMFFIYKILSRSNLVKHGTAFVFNGEILTRVTRVLRIMFIDLFCLGNWQVLWLILVASLLFYFYKIKKHEIRFLIVALGMFFLFDFCLLAFTEFYFWITPAGGGALMSRLILHFYPLLPALIVLLISKDRLSQQ